MGFFDFFKKKDAPEVQADLIIRPKIEKQDIEIDLVYQEPVEDSLLPGEIYLLHWANGRPTNTEPPGYFLYRYGIATEKSYKKLEKKGYLKKVPSLKPLKVTELKDILRMHNLKVSGKKAELIERIEKEIGLSQVKGAVEVYAPTHKGETLIEKHSDLIINHGDPQFPYIEVLKYRKSMPKPYHYNDLKWAYLNDSALETQLKKEYGFFRNIQHQRYNLLRSENKLVEALSYLILVIILDISGLDNSYAYFGYPQKEFNFFAPGIFQDYITLRLQTEQEDFEAAFHKAETLFKPIQPDSLLSNQDLSDLKAQLRKFDERTFKKRFNLK